MSPLITIATTTTVQPPVIPANTITTTLLMSVINMTNISSSLKKSDSSLQKLYTEQQQPQIHQLHHHHHNLIDIDQDVNTKYLNFVANGLLDTSGVIGDSSGGNEEALSISGFGSMGASGSGGSMGGVGSSESVTSVAEVDSGANGVVDGSFSVPIDALSESHLTFVIVKCFIIGFIILAAILGNMLVIVSVMRHRKLR